MAYSISSCLPDTASLALRRTNHALYALGLLITYRSRPGVFCHMRHALGTRTTLPLSFVFGNSPQDVFPSIERDATLAISASRSGAAGPLHFARSTCRE